MALILKVVAVIEAGGMIGKIIATALVIFLPSIAIYTVISSVPNATTILTTIREEAHLDTIRATYSIQVSAGIIDGFNGMYSFSGEYRGDGEIVAGIDLGDFDEGDIVADWRNITLYLPPPKFTSCTITNFRLVDRSITLFTGANWERLYQLATIDGYYSLTEMGIENNLLEQAEREAANILEDILSRATNKNIIVHYATDGRGENSDPDCTPPFPSGWAKEDVNFAWIRVP